jgi:hypothetical protein
MNYTAEFIRHVASLTSHSEKYSRQLLDSKVWCMVEDPKFSGCWFLTTTDLVMPDDIVRHQGTHQECVEFLVKQFTKES